MHKARAFFFVCAGLLCLALVGQSLVKSAWGNGSGPRFVAMSQGTGTYAGFPGMNGTLAVTADGEVYFRSAPSGPQPGPWEHESTVGASSVVAMSHGRGQDGTTGTRVFASDGTVYFRRDGMATSWVVDSQIGATGIVAVAYGRDLEGIQADLVLTVSGEVFSRRDMYPYNLWRFDTSILGTPTDTAAPSWGSLKARYATPQGKAGQMTLGK